MNPLLFDLLRLVGVVVLVLANGFFVAAEFALVSVRPTRIAELIRQGNPAARFVKKAIDDPDRFIAATQLGITIASLGLGWLGEPALAHFIEPVLGFLPEAWIGVAAHSVSAALAFGVITFLHVVIGELAPKSIALQNPETTSLFVAQPTLWTEWIFKPFIWLLNGAGNSLLKLLGVQPAGHQLVHSVEELKMLVEASEAGGVLEDTERDMLDAVFDFADLLVRQVTVPRTEIVAVPADMPFDELLRKVVDHPHTKFPVYEETLDQIVGIVHVKDLIRPAARDGQVKATARDLMREPLFVPETTRVDGLLQQFRARRQHMAIVLDEYGGTAGLVTLEDLLDEIVGEVRDPFDVSGPEIQRLPDGSALINGLTLIEEVNEEFGLELKDPHYDTIAGFILGRLGRLAKVGDNAQADGVRLRVEALDGLRIARIRLSPAPLEEDQALAVKPHGKPADGR